MCMRKTQTKKATTWQDYMPLRLQFSILAISRLIGQKSAQKEESVKMRVFFASCWRSPTGLGLRRKRPFKSLKQTQQTSIVSSASSHRHFFLFFFFLPRAWNIL